MTGLLLSIAWAFFGAVGVSVCFALIVGVVMTRRCGGAR